MKISKRTFTWLLVFLWFNFMGVTFVSFGLGAFYPPLNKIAQPLVCSNGSMTFSENSSNPMPGTTITQIGWYCVDSKTGIATQMAEPSLHVYAGILYGLLMFVAAVTIWHYYQKGIVWVQKTVRFMGVAAIITLILIPMIPLIGLVKPKVNQKPTPAPDAAATALERTFVSLTSKITSDFSATDKPLADWGGIPIMPQAIAGQQANSGTYTFKVPVDSGTIASYYSDKLKSLGWNLSGHRWQGMKFTRDKIVLLVTFVPAADMQSWVVTLVRIP